MDRIAAQRTLLTDRDFTFLADNPYVYHCHHFNLFHDQTIDDVLGDEAGIEVRTRAARSAFAPLLRGLFAQIGATTRAERLQLAAGLLPWMGQGLVEISVDERGGTALGTSLHYGHTWLEKYGDRAKRMQPADAVAAGFVAAVGEAVYDLEPGTLDARETGCITRREPHCRFEIRDAPVVRVPPRVGRAAIESRAGVTPAGLDEARIGSIADGLRGFVRGVGGDARGLVQAFGVYVTMHLSNYYNETAYTAIHHVEELHPKSAGLAEALLREAGNVCVFNTFGGILVSPEWEGMVGPLTGAVEDTLSWGAAIARGLGFGHWAIAELVPGRRLVLRTAADYESPFYRARYGPSDKPRCYFLQGASQALMLLAHEVDWLARPALTQAFYQRLFHAHAGELPWRVEETTCVCKGDALCEVVVTRA